MGRFKSAIRSLLLISGLWLAAPAQAAFIGGALSVTDLGAPSTFGFTLSVPLAPSLTGIVNWSATVSGTLTDATGDGISATPTGSGIFGFLIDGTEVATDTLGTISTSPFSDSISGNFDCGVVGCSSIGATINFTGSGAGDSYGLQFQFALAPASVPEPGALALLAIGIGGLAALQRRRR